MSNFINSSNIADYDHDPATGELIVTFKSGRRYKYKGVPTKVADGLQASLSPGRYVWDNIRGQYDAEEL
jgi:hypothetical protein